MDAIECLRKGVPLGTAIQTEPCPVGIGSLAVGTVQVQPLIRMAGDNRLPIKAMCRGALLHDQSRKAPGLAGYARQRWGANRLRPGSFWSQSANSFRVAPDFRGRQKRKFGNTQNKVECWYERGNGTGLRRADGRVPIVRVTEYARAPRRGEGALAQPLLPPQSAAGGEDR